MVSSRRLLLALTAAVVLSASAHAAQPFSAKDFEATQGSGKTVLIDVSAPWCPVCRKQKPIIESIQRELPQLQVFEVDFDSAKEVLTRFGVRQQSTLIVFKGGREVGRSTGETDAARIRALVNKGL